MRRLRPVSARTALASGHTLAHSSLQHLTSATGRAARPPQLIDGAVPLYTLPLDSFAEEAPIARFQPVSRVACMAALLSSEAFWN